VIGTRYWNVIAKQQNPFVKSPCQVTILLQWLAPRILEVNQSTYKDIVLEDVVQLNFGGHRQPVLYFSALKLNNSSTDPPL
jgi:hypothetical protein